MFLLKIGKLKIINKVGEHSIARRELAFDQHFADF